MATWTDGNGNHNGNLASFLATADIPTVESLSLNSKSLTSITDVQYLTGLQYLSLNANLLTSLDVSGLATLVTLNATNNLLSSINLDGCPLLVYLDLTDNELTSIDTSLIPHIWDLNLTANQLSSLDTSVFDSINTINVSLNTGIVIALDGNWPAMHSCLAYQAHVASLDMSTWTQIYIFDLSETTGLSAVTFPASGSLDEAYLSYSDVVSLDLGYCLAVYLYADHAPLTSVTLTYSGPAQEWLFNSCALDAASVNAILTRLEADAIGNMGLVALNDGTNAAPTGAGITAKNNLISAGWSVTTN